MYIKSNDRTLNVNRPTAAYRTSRRLSARKYRYNNNNNKRFKDIRKTMTVFDVSSAR